MVKVVIGVGVSKVAVIYPIVTCRERVEVNRWGGIDGGMFGTRGFWSVVIANIEGCIGAGRGGRKGCGCRSCGKAKIGQI